MLTISLASYPGLLAPAFVDCSTNPGEGLVKLSHVVWRTLTCGGVAHSFCTAVKRLSESKKRRQACLMSSAQSFYGLCLQSVAHSLTCCFSGKVPLLHTSRYIIQHDSGLPGTRLPYPQFCWVFSPHTLNKCSYNCSLHVHASNHTTH